MFWRSSNYYIIPKPELFRGTFWGGILYGFPDPINHHVCLNPLVSYMDCPYDTITTTVNWPSGCFSVFSVCSRSSTWMSNFPTYPERNIPKRPPFPTVYGLKEFLQHFGVKGEAWGMRCWGYVGVPLESMVNGSMGYNPSISHL